MWLFPITAKWLIANFKNRLFYFKRNIRIQICSCPLNVFSVRSKEKNTCIIFSIATIYIS